MRHTPEGPLSLRRALTHAWRRAAPGNRFCPKCHEPNNNTVANKHVCPVDEEGEARLHNGISCRSVLTELRAVAFRSPRPAA